MHRGHYLRPNWKTVLPRHHCFVATSCKPADANGDALELGAWGLTWAEFLNSKVYTERTVSGTVAGEFWPLLAAHCHPRDKTWIWFLNPRVDIPALAFTRRVEDGTFKRRYWVWGDPPTIIDGWLWGRPVRMVGLHNWLPGDVKHLWEMLGMTGDPHEISPVMEQSHKTVASHGSTVVAACVSRILSTCCTEDLGHLRSTVGGQAYQSYRHKHLKAKVLVHLHPESLALERQCAIGWPPDVKRVGTVIEPVTVVDVNGLYPSVMGRYPYPRRKLWHTTNATVDDLKIAGQAALLIARVTVNDPMRNYLITVDGKAANVTGKWIGTICGPDLDDALSRGCVEHVWEATGYEASYLFTTWAEDVWTMRCSYKRAGDLVGAHVAKMLSVSLWGQFAQRLERYLSTDEISPVNPYGEFFYHPVGSPAGIKCRAVAGLVDKLDCRVDPPDSIPSIAAFVACYARAFMSGIRACAGEENVLYQVADALHVNSDGLCRLQALGLIQDGIMGMLKIVRRVTRTTYLAANTMIQDGVLTASGVYAKATEVTPGKFRWRLPRRLVETILEPPTGLVETPTTERSVAGANSQCTLPARSEWTQLALDSKQSPGSIPPPP